MTDTPAVTRSLVPRVSRFVGRVVRPSVVCLALLALPDAARAHPHVFIDAGVEFVFDESGQLSALRIVWVYDDFTSLLIVGERGLDADGDNALTPEERAGLRGFDMAWVDGFEGDTYLQFGDTSVALGAPKEYTADYAQGRVISTHLRDLASPVDPVAHPIVVQVYDPGYYSAYTIAAEPVMRGRSDCRAQLFAPDPAAGDAAFQAAMEELSGTDLEMNFPAIGAAFAEELRLTCGTPS